MSTKPKIVYFLIIGVLISGVFYVLKNSDFIDNLWLSQEPEYRDPLPGFEAKKTPVATTTSTPAVNLVPQENLILTQNDILFDVPFTAQAPFGNWEDIRQQNGCEEAAALMAMRWVEGKKLTLEEAKKEIIAISDYELKNYGHFHDTSAKDFVDRIFKSYFKYDNVEIKYDIDTMDIKAELVRGNLVLVPVNGQELNNPHYTPPGPLEHMLVIKGYNKKTGEFITNDPGTKRGESLRYSERVVIDAIFDYPTGYHEPITEIRKVMIVVKPKLAD